MKSNYPKPDPRAGAKEKMEELGILSLELSIFSNTPFRYDFIKEII